MTKAKRGRGRPSLYTPELAELICERIAAGESLVEICEDERMPSAATVRLWAIDDREGFSALSARAYGLGYETLAEQCLKIADTPVEGIETTLKADGGEEVKRGDMLGHRKLQIETRMRLLGKWAPKRYGDKLELAGSKDSPLTVVVERLTDGNSGPKG